jgi:hypothetical protein
VFAALEVATRKVTDACYPRHRHEELLRFLKQVAKGWVGGGEERVELPRVEQRLLAVLGLGVEVGDPAHDQQPRHGLVL